MWAWGDNAKRGLKVKNGHLEVLIYNPFTNYYILASVIKERVAPGGCIQEGHKLCVLIIRNCAYNEIL